MDIAKIRRKLKESRNTEDIAIETLKEESSLSALPSDTYGGRKEASLERTDEISTKIEKAEGNIELLVFSLYNEDYAFRVTELEEIIRPQQITYIPKTPEYLLGVTSLRGKIIPVIDLKRMLLLAGEEGPLRQKIIILKGRKGPIGVRVDRITGVVRLPISWLTECPHHLNESQMRYIDQVALFKNRFISIIKAEELANIMLNMEAL